MYEQLGFTNMIVLLDNQKDNHVQYHYGQQGLSTEHTGDKRAVSEMIGNQVNVVSRTLLLNKKHIWPQHSGKLITGPSTSTQCEQSSHYLFLVQGLKMPCLCYCFL